MNLSALILTKDEEEVIEDCLKQLKFVDEIIVLDQNSKDKTLQIAQKYTQKIYTTSNTEFGKNRNQLSSLAKGKWLLYLDADERIQDAQVEQIKKAIRNNDYSAYFFPRKNFILGKWLKHGGWWPDYVPRLFKKDQLIKWTGEVHESPQIHGNFGYINSPIDHLTARSMTKMFLKTTKWAKVEAKLYYKAGHPKVNVLRVIKVLLLEFTNRYLVKFGFLDGVIGLIESIFQSLHKSIILVYLWELQNKTLVTKKTIKK